MNKSEAARSRKHRVLGVLSRKYRFARFYDWPFFCVFAVLVCTGSSAAAAPVVSRLEALHTSWTDEEGRVLPPVRAVVQAPDGYLWLGSPEGLLHFDGMRFVAWKPREGEQLPGNDIHVLIPALAGGFWVGTDAGLCRVDRGHVIRYEHADQDLRWPVFGMVQDSSGDLLVLGLRNGSTTLAILRANASVQIYSTLDGLPDARFFTMHREQGGPLWLGTGRGLCAWQPGSRAVCYGPSVRPVSIVADGGGGLLLIDGSKEILRFRNGEFHAVVENLASLSLWLRSVIRDRDGNIWVGTVGQGLLRLRGGRLERFERRDGLSSNLIMGMLEDREGNVWTATDRGIDRFRDSAVTRLSSRTGLSSDVVAAVSPARDGSVWIGMAGAGVDRYQDGAITRYSTAAGLPGATVLALGSDANGRLWAGTIEGPAYWSGQRFVPVAAPKGTAWAQTHAIASSPRGEVYVADTRLGLCEIHNGVATQVPIPGVAAAGIYRLHAARSGELWIGFYQNGAAVLRNGETRFYNSHQGLAGGAVQAIYEDSQGSIWIGAKEGLSRFHNGVWTTWSAREGLSDSVQSIMEDSTGGFWILSPNGLLRIAVDELIQTPDGDPRPLRLVRFGKSAGLSFAHDASPSGPHLSRSEDGRLWIPTGDGVAIVDPERLHVNPTAPAIVVEEMWIDGKPIDIQAAAPPSIRGNELSFTYTAVSMAAPEEVRFKYRLDGNDRRGLWNEAGTRRNTAYVRLPPGHYRFHVIASNSDGVWNMAGASVQFQVIPYFYQTGWFMGACAGGFSLLVWGLHRLHVRRVVYRFQLAARERTRVTRELHDSLLQGFSGVVWQLEAASRLFDVNPEISRQKLEHALDQADEALLETRRTLTSLRLPAVENRTLPEAIREIGARLTEGMPAVFHCTVKGTVRLLGYEEQANLYLIGREAITNAVNHGEAKHILAHLTYTSSEVRLTVTDDGAGFDPEAMATREDHWGLAGMRERAHQVAADFKLETGPGQGTTVTVTLLERHKINHPLRFLRAVLRRDTISN